MGKHPFDSFKNKNENLPKQESPRRLMMEVIAVPPAGVTLENFLRGMGNYLEVHKFVIQVIRINAYAPNSSLQVTEISSPQDYKVGN